MPEKLHTIAIEVTGDTLKVTPPKLEAGNEDEIEWECDEPWALVFEPPPDNVRGKPFNDGPFQDNKRVRKNGQGKPNKGKVKAHKGKDRVRYKYTVACYTGGEVHIADPEVIIDPTRRG